MNVDLAVWDDTVQLISALGKTGSRLTPSVILETYGIPDEVWLRTFSERREDVLDFEVVLVYLEQGFLIWYGTQAILNGEDVVGCIHNLYETLVLVAWNPKLRLNFAEAMKIGMSGHVTTEYLGLEAATGKTLQSFYNDFSTGGSEVCLRTPRQLWPDP